MPELSGDVRASGVAPMQDDPIAQDERLGGGQNDGLPSRKHGILTTSASSNRPALGEAGERGMAEDGKAGSFAPSAEVGAEIDPWLRR
jgi:hypothetical protein